MHLLGTLSVEVHEDLRGCKKTVSGLIHVVRLRPEGPVSSGALGTPLTSLRRFPIPYLPGLDSGQAQDEDHLAERPSFVYGDPLRPIDVAGFPHTPYRRRHAASNVAACGAGVQSCFSPPPVLCGERIVLARDRRLRSTKDCILQAAVGCAAGMHRLVSFAGMMSCKLAQTTAVVRTMFRFRHAGHDAESTRHRNRNRSRHRLPGGRFRLRFRIKTCADTTDRQSTRFCGVPRTGCGWYRSPARRRLPHRCRHCCIRSASESRCRLKER